MYLPISIARRVLNINNIQFLSISHFLWINNHPWAFQVCSKFSSSYFAHILPIFIVLFENSLKHDEYGSFIVY